MEQKRAWIYCRIAHGSMDRAEVLAAQRHSLDAYAKEHSLEIVGFSNDIGNGLTMDRPGLLDFLAAAEKGAVDILLIRSHTRLGRDADKVMMYWRLFRDLGVSIHSADCGEVDLSLEQAMTCGLIEEMKRAPKYDH